MDIWAVVRKTCEIRVLSVSVGSTLDGGYISILALRSQIFEYLRESFYRQALEYLGSSRKTKYKKKHVFFLRKFLGIIVFLEGVRVDDGDTFLSLLYRQS